MNFPHDHSLYHGYLQPEHPLLESADLIFGLGNRMFFEFSWDRTIKMNPQVSIIHMNTDPWEISKNKVVSVPIISGIKLGLTKLLAELGVESKPSLTVTHKAQEGLPDKFREEKNLTLEHLAEVLHFIYHNYPVTIVDQSVSHSRKLLQTIKYTRPGSLFRTSGGCLGWAVAAGMGVALGKTGGRVISIIGDGGFMFAPQALWTAAHYNIPITIIILNNLGYSIYRFMDKVNDSNRIPGILEQPAINFCQLSAGQGITARRATCPSELVEHLTTSLNNSKPMVIEAFLSKETISAEIASMKK